MDKPNHTRQSPPVLPQKLTSLLSAVLRYMEQTEQHMKGEIK